MREIEGIAVQFSFLLRLFWLRSYQLLSLPVLLLLLPLSLLADYEGFGSTTPGGKYGESVEVTSLEDSGPGTLSAALKRKKEEAPLRIVFQISGTIHLNRPLKIGKRSFITLDGATAPGAGITLTGNGLDIRDSHDIIVTHIRVRNPRGDGITVKGSHHLIIDHCSLTDAGDENIAITQDTHDVTVSWCIIGDTRPTSLRLGLRPKGVLIANFAKPAVTNVSLHHNLFANESQRSPQVSTAGLFDIRNNVVWDWQAYGIRMRRGARGNIINNVFKTETNARRAVLLAESPGPVYIGGNQGPGDFDVNRLGTASDPFAVATVSTDSAAEVQPKVLQGAGAWPRDALDAALVGGSLAPVGEKQESQNVDTLEHRPDHTGADAQVSEPPAN